MRITHPSEMLSSYENHRSYCASHSCCEHANEEEHHHLEPHHVAIQSLSVEDQQELLRRSYHESFFVKNTPVTGDEQVTAWLDVNRTGVGASPARKCGRETFVSRWNRIGNNETTKKYPQAITVDRQHWCESDDGSQNEHLLARQGSAPQARALGEQSSCQRQFGSDQYETVQRHRYAGKSAHATQRSQ